MIKKIEITDVVELSGVADQLLPFVKSNTIFLLNGEMAAGKTTLISTLLLKLNITDVSSPTYAIHQTYSMQNVTIHHFDLHRLETADEIETSGIWDEFENTNNIFFIEWSNKINIENWPMNFKIINIDIEKKTESTRSIEIKFIN